MDAKRTILIINDQLLNRKLFSKMLKSEYRVLTAENKEEAFQVLYNNQERKPISAIFLNIGTSESNRYTLLEEIQKEEIFFAIPIIAVIQSREEKEGMEALWHGASDFILNPYYPEIVQMRLRNLIWIAEARNTQNTIDALTGLLTKEAFYNKVEEALKSDKTGFFIVAVDVEQFKVFNDTYGEAEGDILLKRIAAELNRAFGKEHLIAHGYADQFFLFTQEQEGLEQKILQISDRIQNEFPLTRVSIKFGIYEIKEQNHAVYAMCDRALLAIEVIKNQYDKVFSYYNETLRENLIVEQKITGIMKQALEQGQFQVFYQPKFDTDVESVVGAEALVRWMHPEYGFLSPSKFVPVFEKNGFITEMDKYVWEEVCIFLKKQKDNGKKNIPISINVSRKDIYNEDLIQYFPKLIEKYGLEARWLHLEVTESAYSENPQQLIYVLTQLRERGFVIEMDDFGSGYSSLNALSEIPIDVLKLDMKFIQNEFLHKNSNNIISSVINLAKWMNLLIVAEGVESREQLEHLKELKCNIIQGYYFTKPMREAELEKMLEEWDIQPVYDIDSYIQNSIRKKEKQAEINIMLVVDDLALNRVILREYFEEEYNIKECSNGIEAWEFIQRNYENIQVIMLDLYMPGMDGFELLKLLKEDEWYKQIPVIITSQAGGELEQKLPGIQVDGILSKPYLKEEAMQLVADALIHRIRNVRQGKAGFQQRFFETMEASLDGLTRVLNQSAFEREVREFLRGQERAVLIFLKIDRFAQIIQKTELLEEQVLVKVAELLKSNVRAYDLIGRVEENQFVLLLKTSISQERLENRIGGLQNRMSFCIQGVEIGCTFGVCLCMEEDHDYEILYENAKRAFLAAEAEGGKRYRISERMLA